MYPRAFAYHRAKSYPEAVSLLGELGEEAKLLAGGQSLIPLMKLRLSTPRTWSISISFRRRRTSAATERCVSAR